MELLSESIISKVRDNANILDVATAYGMKFRTRNGRYESCCPFHSEKTPSFKINRDFKTCHCYGCGKHFDSIGFVMEKDGLSFRDAVKAVASICHIIISEKKDHEEDDYKPKNEVKDDVEVEPLKFFDRNSVEAWSRRYEETGLFRYLSTTFPERISDIKRAFKAYMVGYSADKVLQGVNATIFPSIDEEGRVWALKYIPFGSLDHHRIKSMDGMKVMYEKPNKYPHRTVFFGTHLVVERPDAPIALVESEKSAVVGSIFCPDYVWLATQGKDNLKLSNCEFLKGKTICLFPDKDGIEIWRPIMNKLIGKGYSVVMMESFFSDFTDDTEEYSHADICDILISTYNSAPQQDAEPLADVDALVRRICSTKYNPATRMSEPTNIQEP